MAFCSKCGKKISEKAKFCSNCGEEVDKKDYVEKATKVVEKIMNTEDSTKKYTKKDIEENRIMALLSYILAPIPYFVDKTSKFVRYHAIQGMNLFSINICYTILCTALTNLIKVKTMCKVFAGVGYYCEITPWWINLPLTLVGIGLGALGVIGIINVIQGKAKELPIIGNLKIFR